MEFATNQDIYEIIGKLNSRYEKIASDYIRISNFFLIRSLGDKTLTVYTRKGVVSSATVSNIKEIGLSDRRTWSISNFGRICFGRSEYFNGKWSAFIDEYREINQTWKRQVFKSLIELVYGVCMMKDRIMITGDVGGDNTRVELLTRNFDKGSFSNRLCNTPLPGNAVNGYSITSIQGDRVVLAGGHTTQNGIKLATAFEGSLNENESDINWMELPSMKIERSYHAALNLENKLYVVGGGNSSYKWLDCSEVFDVVRRTWSDGPTLPYALMYPKTVTNFNESFALVIGRKPGGDLKRNVIAFDDKRGFEEVISTIF